MKYLVIGAGGTGGALGAYLARAGKDVTLIARGKHLEAMQDQGLRVIKPGEEFTIAPIAVSDMEHYEDTPDVIFVCVKGYSVESVLPFIRRVAGKHTIVIPILNIYGTGGEMQKELPELLVTDGCMYVASEIREPGCIWMKGDILRVVFGVREASDWNLTLERIEKDLQESQVLGILSKDIRKDALLKFSYVSPQGACGLYYDVPAGEIQKPGEIRDCFVRLVKEIDLLAKAMGITFDEDIAERNLKILDDLHPEMTTSLQRDVAAGRDSEIDGLIHSVVRLGKSYGVALPEYEKISEYLKKQQ
ncbi:MAG: 2-dehydropantoate 2-reductase [Eubacteriales bacterium]|nr:2-dehydropantoate 2-reductase [Eubacteriales bacterium]